MPFGCTRSGYGVPVVQDLERSLQGDMHMRGFVSEFRTLLIIGVVAAAGAVIVRDNRHLSAENEQLRRLAYEPRAGLFVPPLVVPTLDGDSVVLGRQGDTQLLFFFNTTCLHCRSSLPAWNGIAERLRADSGVSVWGVAFDDSIGASAYAEAQAVRFRVIPVPDPRVAGLYRINAVPAVVLVNREGKMAYTRVGPLGEGLGTDSILDAVRRAAAPDSGG